MEFHYKDLIFEVPDNVYYPREDSLLLAEQIEKENMKGKRCLDMGCGCGFLGILMSKTGGDVIAVDINEEAVSAAEKNADANNVFMITRKSDLFENIDDKFDIIVFNAPYLPAKEKNELAYYGGPTGRLIIERFLTYAKDFLLPKGKILLLVSTVTGEKEIQELAQKNGFMTCILKRKKIPWEELIVMEIKNRSQKRLKHHSSQEALGKIH